MINYLSVINGQTWHEVQIVFDVERSNGMERRERRRIIVPWTRVLAGSDTTSLEAPKASMLEQPQSHILRVQLKPVCLHQPQPANQHRQWWGLHSPFLRMSIKRWERAKQHLPLRWCAAYITLYTAGGERGAITPSALAPNSNNPLKLLEASPGRNWHEEKRLFTHFVVLSRLNMAGYRLTFMNGGVQKPSELGKCNANISER